MSLSLTPRDGLRLVKRVVAIGGDQVCVVGNRLLINGEPCDYGQEHSQRVETFDGRSRMVVLSLNSAAAHANFSPIKIPPDMFFVLGDNRDECIDSRDFGAVSRSLIIGGVSIVAYSQDSNQWFSTRRDRVWLRIK